MEIWKCRDKKIEYGNKIVLMGIVNITPDSFSDGGKYLNPENAVSHALQLLKDGADIIDLGAQSTRPNYEEISAEEEWERLYPVLSALREKTNAPISIDTYFPSVAQKALENGADIINDISGHISKKMVKLIKETGAGWIVTHNGEGNAETVRQFFLQTSFELSSLGIKLNQLCFDMGIGFGKSYENNLELIARVSEYKRLGVPLMLGVSRKRVIAAAGGEFIPENRTYGNIAADTAAVFGGVDIIRLHDVKNEKQGIKTAWELKKWIR